MYVYIYRYIYIWIYIYIYTYKKPYNPEPYTGFRVIGGFYTLAKGSSSHRTSRKRSCERRNLLRIQFSGRSSSTSLAVVFGFRFQELGAGPGFCFCFGVAPALVWLAGFLAFSWLLVASWLLGVLASWLFGFLVFWPLGCLASWLLGFSAFGSNIENCCISLLPLLPMRLLATRAMKP